jgi:hypothetical protein
MSLVVRPLMMLVLLGMPMTKAVRVWWEVIDDLMQI